MATSLTTIKNWFKTGLKPTQAQFWATWDSFRHKDEAIPQTDVQGLETTLNAKVETVQFNAHLNAENAHAAQIAAAIASASKFLGTYTTLLALQTAHPSPTVGSYAYVDAGIGSDVVTYIYDNTDNEFVLQTGSGTTETTASIQAKRPLKTINSTSLEGTGNVVVGAPMATTPTIEKPFDPVLLFDYQFTVFPQVTQTTDITFTKSDVGRVLFGACYVRIVSNGVNDVRFSAFKQQSGSANFVNQNGILNVLCFWWDGVDYWVNIWQEVGSIVIPPNVSGLIDFTQFFGAIQNVTTKVVTGGANTGAYSSVKVFTDGYIIQSKNSTNGSVLGLTLTNDNLFAWSTGQENLLLGIYQYNGITYAAKRNPSTGKPLNIAQTTGAFTYKKIQRVGNNLVASVSNDGITFTTFHTETGVFSTANPQVYIKAQFSVAGGSLLPNQII